MKTFPVILALVAFAAFSAPAQVVGVKVVLEQDQFLPGETLPVTVRVVNNSGQTLHLGANQNWLKFSVTSQDGNAIVERLSDPPVVGAFTLESSQVATKRVDIAPSFLLNHAGQYRVTATVHIAEWGTDVVSPPGDFDVIDGAEIWSQDFGVPTGVTNEPPEVRKYVLEEANYLKRQLRMYVMVSNQTKSHIFKSSAIGPMVSFSHPEVQLDQKSCLHVLYQSSAHTFIYSVVNPNGEIKRQDIYDVLDVRPRLGLDGSNNIVVVGGVRRMTPDELPPIQAPVALPPPPKPAPTKK